MAYSHEFFITDGAERSVIPEIHSNISSMRKHVEAVSATDGTVYGNYETLTQTLGMVNLALKLEKKADRLSAVIEDSILLKFLHPRMIDDFSRLIAIMPHYVNPREIPPAMGYRTSLIDFIAKFSAGVPPFTVFDQDSSQKIIHACEENINQILQRFGLDIDLPVSGSELKLLWSSHGEFDIPHIPPVTAIDIALTGALAIHLSASTGGHIINERLCDALPGIARTVYPEGYHLVGKLMLPAMHSQLAKYFPTGWVSN